MNQVWGVVLEVQPVCGVVDAKVKEKFNHHFEEYLVILWDEVYSFHELFDHKFIDLKLPQNQLHLVQLLWIFAVFK